MHANENRREASGFSRASSARSLQPRIYDGGNTARINGKYEKSRKKRTAEVGQRDGAVLSWYIAPRGYFPDKSNLVAAENSRKTP